VVGPVSEAFDVMLGVAIGTRLRDVVGERDEDGVLDPFPKRALGVVMELTDGMGLGDSVELSDGELELVPLPNGAVAASILLIVVEGIVEPVEADELPDPLPDGVGVAGILAVNMGLVELTEELSFTRLVGEDSELAPLLGGVVSV
jgi:hypothetical protein